MSASAAADHAPRLRRLALLGVIANVVLACVKLAAGVAGNSYALIADAIESLADVLGSLVIWGGFRVGAIPPDEDHPYGHGKAEALAGLIVAGMIALAGLGIAAESIREILTPHHAPAPFTLAVLVAVVATKEILFRIVRRASRAAGSSAAEIDAGHHRADAITSLFAFIGISVALIGGEGWEPADDVAALLASGIILYNAWALARVPIHELMDRAPAPDDPFWSRVRSAAAGVEGVRHVEKVHARKHGLRHYVDMHVHVDGAMPVSEAHVISGKVKSAVREAVPSVANVLVHIEPEDGGSGHGLTQMGTDETDGAP